MDNKDEIDSRDKWCRFNFKISHFLSDNRNGIRTIPRWCINILLLIIGIILIIVSIFFSSSNNLLPIITRIPHEIIQIPQETLIKLPIISQIISIIYLIIPIISQNYSDITQIYSVILKIINDLGIVLVSTSILLLIQDMFYNGRYDGINRPPPFIYLPHVHEQLNMLGITLYDFHKYPNFTEKLKVKALETKLGVEYKFLLLFPLSQEFISREKEEEKSLLNECDEALFQLLFLKNEICKGNNNKCEIRFYNSCPRRSVIITDKSVFVGPYFYGKAGFESKWMVISKLLLAFQYRKEFDQIWEKSLPFDYTKCNIEMMDKEKDKVKIMAMIKAGYQDISFPPIAIFTANPTSGTCPMNVSFKDESLYFPTEWKWEFGDGTTSDKQNPDHIYEVAKTYTVKLTVTNGNPKGIRNSEEKVRYITVNNPADEEAIEYINDNRDYFLKYWQSFD